MRKNSRKRKPINGQSTRIRPKGEKDRPLSTTGVRRDSQHGETRARWPTPAARKLIRALKAARTAARIPGASIAASIGVDQSTLWRWENGAVVPRQPALTAWCKAMEVILRDEKAADDARELAAEQRGHRPRNNEEEP